MLSENYVILFQNIFWYRILRITNGTHRFCLNHDRKKPLQQSRLLRNPLDIKKKYFQVCRRFWKIILFTVTILPKDTRLAWDFWVGARDDTSSKGKIVFTTGWPYLAEVTLSGWSVHHHLPHWISVKWPGIFDKWLWGFCSITSSHRTSRKSSWIPNLLGDGI